MLIYLVNFPSNFWPRTIAYKTFHQAYVVCRHYNLPSKKSIKIVYLETDEDRIPFINGNLGVDSDTQE